MKNQILIASLLAGVTLCGLGAFGQSNDTGPSNPAPQGPGRPRMSFSALDLNGDGSVSEDEFNQARSQMRGGPGPGGGLGRGPGQRGPGRPEGEIEKPREAQPKDASVTPPSGGEPKERMAESLDRPEGAPRRERAPDGEGGGIRERRRDGAVGRSGEGRPWRRHEANLRERPGRADRDGGEFRRGPRPDRDRGDRQGRGRDGFRGEERREMASGGEPRRHGMAGGDRRPARDGMGPRGERRGGSDRGGVCPHCGRAAGPRENGDGEGRGPRRMAPRG